MLQSFLRGLAGQTFQPGKTGCIFSLADWWLLNHGVDPAAAYRGVCATDEECTALLKREGGLLRLVARIAFSVGAKRTRAPQPGDFGVILAEHRCWGAIKAPSGRWAVKANDGVTMTSKARVVSAWSIR